MSNAGIFFIGGAISVLCLVGLALSIVELKRLGRGGGERALSMAVGGAPQRPTRDRNAG